MAFISNGESVEGTELVEMVDYIVEPQIRIM